MEHLKEQIQNTVRRINEVTELLYQKKNNEAFSRFDDVLLMLASLAEEIFSANEVVSEEKASFLKLLKEAMNAMENKDFILLSDILQYDIIELLENIIRA